MDDTNTFRPSSGKSYVFSNWTELVNATAKSNVIKEVTVGNHELDILKQFSHESVRSWSTIQRKKADALTSGYLPNSIQSTTVNAEINGSKELLSLKPAILNAILFYKNTAKELELMQTQNNCYTFIKEFIVKLQTALKKEKQFSQTLDKKYSMNADVTRRTSTGSSNSESNFQDSDIHSSEYRSATRKLPKLGKVYAELRSCMKSCDETEKLWLSKTGFGRASALTSLKLKEKCFVLQGEMLLHVKWLIESRLRNIGKLISSNCVDINEVFCSNENKKFCKLFDVYNQYAVAYTRDIGQSGAEFLCCCGQQFMQNNTHGLAGAASEFNTPSYTEMCNTLRPSVIHKIDVKDILDLISEEFMMRVGESVGHILSSCKIFHSLPTLKHSKLVKNRSNNEFLWEDASKIEVRPVQTQKSHKSSFFRVIKRVAGMSVPDLDTEQTGQCCDILTTQFSKHQEAVSLLLFSIGGKTKILRRSHNFDSYLSDDTISVASSENRSTSSYVRHNETKSVVWRDSWNNDAMKLITAQYLEFLTSSISNFYSLHSSNPQSSWNAVTIKKCSKEAFYVLNDVEILLLQAIVSNIGHLNVMTDDLHNSLMATSGQMVITSALACSDGMFSEMLGKCTPPFDKPLIQKLPDTDISLVPHCCITSLQPLIYVLEFYSRNDIVTKNVLPRIEAILSAGFWWIRRKIQDFFSTWNLPSVLRMCLCDLRELTNIGLDCLRLVESCHNYIETKRNQNSAALNIATRHLHNIDSIITNMQVTSGSCMLQLNTETKSVAFNIINNLFPPQKAWIQKNMINNELENKYIQELINSLLKVACEAVVDMNSQSQLAGMTPIVNSVFEACLSHIAKTKVRFTMQGALQLSYDFSAIVNFITTDICGLSPDVRSSLSSLHSVKRALHVSELLQSTSYDNAAFVDDRFRPQSRLRSSTASVSDDDNCGADMENSEFNDKFWLSLRKHNMKKSKSWASFIPCVDQK